MAFFGGNPFSTPAGLRIEQATDASLASENWALNMEICDIINDTEDGPKDAIKAIRKRLHQNVGKNYTVVMYTLTVLETCVKNCGRRFHLLTTSKEFVQELVKLIGPKNDPPTAVQEKVLSLIQSWADAFRGNTEMSGVVQVYQDLKQKGVEFPMTDLDALAPIHTPQRTVPDAEVSPKPTAPSPVRPATVGAPASAPPTNANALPSATAAVASAVVIPVSLTPEQLGKMRSEMDVVQGNLKVFNEMITELTPGKEHPSDLELLQDLYKTLQGMQGRIVELIEKIANEEVTNELLRVNDELNNVFLRYSRFQKNRSGSQQVQSPNARTHADVHSDTAAVGTLIDLDDAESANAPAQNIHIQLAGMNLNSASTTLSQVNSVSAQQGRITEEDEFDMFAQSRQATYSAAKQSGSSYEDNKNMDHFKDTLGAVAQQRPQAPPLRSEQEEYFDEKLQKETDFDEMEAWLEEMPPTSGQNTSTITSSEFDKFLAERAAAIDKEPSISSTATGASLSQSGARRQIEKEETENRLFAL